MDLAQYLTPQNALWFAYGTMRAYTALGSALQDDGPLFRPGGGGGVSGGGRSGGSSGGSSGRSSSGGSSSFSSGSGGSAGTAGGLIALLIFGGVGLVIVVLIVMALRKFAKGGAGGLSGYSSAIEEPVMTQSEEEIVATIAAHDPAFTPDIFKERVGRVYFLTIEAWCNNDAEKIRGQVSDTLFQQWRAQIDGYIQGNRRNIMEQAVLGNVWITSAQHTQEIDTITCRIRAAAADYDIDTTSGKIIRGDKEVRTYMEDWTFQRTGTAQTHQQGAQRQCANCGAPLDVDLAGKCKYCQAPVVSLDYDWVLTRIEQL